MGDTGPGGTGHGPAHAEAPPGRAPPRALRCRVRIVPRRPLGAGGRAAPSSRLARAAPLPSPPHARQGGLRVCAAMAGRGTALLWKGGSVCEIQEIKAKRETKYACLASFLCLGGVLGAEECGGGAGVMVGSGEVGR